MIAFACFCSAFFVSGNWLGLLPLAGLALSFAAGASCLVSRSSLSKDADRPRATHRSTLRVLVCVALALALLNAAVALQALGVARMIAKSQVCRANLRQIGQALRDYHVEQGDYPPTLVDLVESGHLTPNICLSPYDSHGFLNRFREEGYSSYVYMPGNGAWRDDALLILGHQRLPWAWGRMTLWSPRGYSVLFADLSVGWLDIREFEEDLYCDSEFRKEIDWPRPP
jgi:hypothetical protein